MRGDEMKKGSALLIVLGMVAFMVVSAVGFAVFMRHNRIPSSFLRRSTAARELARAALACAMSDIESAIEDNPYPGLGNNGEGHNRWIGRGRVFAPHDVSEGSTVSTLTLEGLAYLPPPMINDVRYYSRRTSTAQWKRLDYDSGRYAFCAVNVSDFFDLSRVYADRPRGSGDQNLVSLAYLFEDGGHRNWGEIDPIDFQDKLNEIISEKSLVSLADYNLALKSHGCDLASPFVEYIEQNGANGFYKDVRTTDKTNPDYLKYAIQRFVVDGHAERDREEWFENRDGGNNGASANPLNITDDLDISLVENQPFPDLARGNDDKEKNDRSAGRICDTSTKFLDSRLEQFNQCEWMALYDYLDMDDVPLTVAAPTVDRAPMIVGIAIDPNSNLKVKIEEKKSDESASPVDDTGIKTYYKTITFYPVFDGSLKVRVGFAYPFKYRSEVYKGKTYKAQAVAKFYPLESGAVWEVGNAAHGCRTSVDSVFGKWDKKSGGKGAFRNGIMTLASDEQDTGIPDKLNGEEEDFVSSNSGGMHDVELQLDGFKSCNSDLENSGFILRYHLKRRVKIGEDGKETELDEGIEVDGQNGWTFNEQKGPKAEVGALLNLPASENFSGASGRAFGLNEASFVWGMSLAVKLRDENGNLVDMAPAHANDDDKDPDGDFAQHIGRLGRPVLRFDVKNGGEQSGFTVSKAEDLAGYTHLHEAHERDSQAVTLSPGAYFTDDPRYNYAAENWYPEQNLGSGDSLGKMWLDKTTCGSDAKKDGDIFMSVSNQGYLQDPGEIAFLPRVCGFSTQDEYSPVKNAATGKIPSGANDVANKGQMWRTYGCFGKLGDDEVDNLRLVSPVKGFRVNPFTNDEMVKLAPFLNTPYDWWAAGTNLSDSVKEKMIDRSGKTTTPETALKYSFGERGVEAKVEFQYMEKLAEEISAKLRSGGFDWYNTWRNMNWIGGSETSICGVDLGRTLHDVDRKFLYSYWRKCYANAQQLFIVFFRAEPVVLGGGSGDGNTPAQLGARGVAVVWRDPIDAKGAKADAPHRMRVLFYRQFD